MAFTTHPLVTRPATWLRPQRNQELTAGPYPDMSRMFEDMRRPIDVSTSWFLHVSPRKSPWK